MNIVSPKVQSVEPKLSLFSKRRKEKTRKKFQRGKSSKQELLQKQGNPVPFPEKKVEISSAADDCRWFFATTFKEEEIH